jgi:long-chain acyl-CoA synthetase
MYTSVLDIIKKTSEQHRDLPVFSLKVGFRTRTYTYKEVYELVHKFPGFLESNGLQKGDKIVLLSLNRPEYAITILGSFVTGTTLVPIDYRTNKETIQKFIQVTQPKLIFTTKQFAPLFEGISIPIIYFEELIDALQKCELKEPMHVEHHELAGILFTSGTTGEPKGTMITFDNILASINNVLQVFSVPAGTRTLSVLPLSHALEMFGGLMVSYSLGCQIHYLERINSITILQALQRYKIEAMAVVPQMLRIMILNIERTVKNKGMEVEWEKANNLARSVPMHLRRKIFKDIHQSLGDHFKFFVCGSAPLEDKLAQQWLRMGIDVLEGYGASETTGFISTNTFHSRKQGTVGKIIPGIGYKTSAEGELYVKGKNITHGYYNNPEKTAESYQDGWFKTGDIVQIDTESFIKIVGRDKFKIVLPDGKKVYPEDIEKKLNDNPNVVDSTVFGINRGEGDIVHAEIITKTPNLVDDIIRTVNQSLNPHEQILDYGVWTEDDFPRTKTLKVDRQAVKDRVMNHSGQQAQQNDSVQVQKDTLLRILTTVSGDNNIDLSGDRTLATDLKLDSLKRIELLAIIEEELGVSVDEMKITPQTTIDQLRQLISEGKQVIIDDGIKLPPWQFTDATDRRRVFVQDYIFLPLLRMFIKPRIIHKENLQKIKTPQLFIFNHVGPQDVFTSIIGVLPSQIRLKTAIAGTHMIWIENKFNGYMATTVGNVLPFIKAESNAAMRGNFERVGQVLDLGYNLAISPEGNFSPDGNLLPFHTGAGYIAVEMQVPVTIFKMNGYRELWPDKPERGAPNYWWPVKRGTVDVIISEPISFAKDTPYEEATRILRQKMIELE